MAHDVFISYSSEDKPTADAVCATLEARKIRCWIAPRDILPGRDYAEMLIEAIRGARLVVLVFSSNSNSSAHVIKEVERAASRNIPILPFRIEDVPPSASMEYYISTTHWLDALTPPLKKHLQTLADTVQQLLARPVRSVEPKEEAATYVPAQRPEPVSEVPMPARQEPSAPRPSRPAAPAEAGRPTAKGSLPLWRRRWLLPLVVAGVVLVVGLGVGIPLVLTGPSGAGANTSSDTSDGTSNPTATEAVASADQRPEEFFVFKGDGDSIVTAPVVSNDYLYCGGDAGYVHWLVGTAENAGEKGGLEIPHGAIVTLLTTSAVGQFVYVGTEGGWVYALDLECNPKWERQLQPEHGAVCQLAMYEGNVIAGQLGGSLYVLAWDTGEVKWEFKPEDGDLQSDGPAVADGVVICSDAGHLNGVDLETGQVKWRFDTTGTVKSRLSVWGQTVYGVSDQCYVYAVDIQTGKQKWSVNEQGMGAYPVLAAEGLVYLFPGGNEFDALDAETGDMKFKGKVSADTVSYSAAVLDNVLYLGTKDGQLHALEPTTGRDLWSTPVSGEVVGPPALCAGVLWYTATDGGLNALK